MTKVTDPILGELEIEGAVFTNETIDRLRRRFEALDMAAKREKRAREATSEALSRLRDALNADKAHIKGMIDAILEDVRLYLLKGDNEYGTVEVLETANPG